MTREQTSKVKMVWVTGPSGAGRTTALHALEDLEFEVIDNLPLSLVPRVLDGDIQMPLALGIDPRNREFDPDAVLKIFDKLSGRTDVDAQFVYLDASRDVLIRRYSETRRRHPFSNGEPPAEAIEHEKEMLTRVKERADILIDTSDLSPHELKAQLDTWFSKKTAQKLVITVQSFSYKRGLPSGADVVFDCRFLKNPHWDEALRALTGRDGAVVDYISTDPNYDAFMRHLDLFSKNLLPAYQEEGKAYLTMCFGCTGGRHRSVALTEMIGKSLANDGWQVSIKHRELERRM